MEMHEDSNCRLLSDAYELALRAFDEKAMSSPRALEVFETFVKLENELVALLQNRLEQDRKMLIEMDRARGA